MFLRNLGRNDGTRSIYVGIGRDYIPEARTGRRENEHSFIERHKAFRWGNICPSVTKREAFEWYTTSVLN